MGVNHDPSDTETPDGEPTKNRKRTEPKRHDLKDAKTGKFTSREKPPTDLADLVSKGTEKSLQVLFKALSGHDRKDRLTAASAFLRLQEKGCYQSGKAVSDTMARVLDAYGVELSELSSPAGQDEEDD